MNHHPRVMCSAETCIASKDCKRHEDSGTLPAKQALWKDFFPALGYSCGALIKVEKSK